MPQVENPAQPPRQTLENHSPSPSQTRRVQAPGLIQKQGLLRYPRFKRLSKPLECSQPIEFTPAWPSFQSSRTQINQARVGSNKDQGRACPSKWRPTLSRVYATAVATRARQTVHSHHRLFRRHLFV